jgi:hypothetical protein
VLMNLLPGVRELRAPLVSGYLWLISAWLVLARLHWLPVDRPSGSGEVARLWDLSGILGRTVLLAAISFVAYLIGSFLEIDHHGLVARKLAPLILRDRRPSYIPKGTNWPARPAKEILDYANLAARSFSVDARRDLEQLMRQKETALKRSRGRLEQVQEVKTLLGTYENKKDAMSKDLKPSRNAVLSEFAADVIAGKVVNEMPQLASRLLVKNMELYGKYDRHMAEAAVRMNVSMALTAFLVLATLLSGLSWGLRVALALVAVAFGVLLLRQGFLRTMSARDVIAQALAINEVRSRQIYVEKSISPSAEEAAASDLILNRIVAALARDYLDSSRSSNQPSPASTPSEGSSQLDKPE